MLATTGLESFDATAALSCTFSLPHVAASRFRLLDTAFTPLLFSHSHECLRYSEFLYTAETQHLAA